MTNDARIARLTELARRVWPQHPSLVVDVEPDWGAANVFDMHPENSGAGVLLKVEDVPNERALDALEAALLVLAGHLRLDRIVPQPTIDDLDARVGKPLAWIEELAQEWESQARDWIAEHLHDDEAECEEACNAEAKQVLRCAAELRARAKRGEP